MASCCVYQYTVSNYANARVHMHVHIYTWMSASHSGGHAETTEEKEESEEDQWSRERRRKWRGEEKEPTPQLFCREETLKWFYTFEGHFSVIITLIIVVIHVIWQQTHKTSYQHAEASLQLERVCTFCCENQSELLTWHWFWLIWRW